MSYWFGLIFIIAVTYAEVVSKYSLLSTFFLFPVGFDQGMRNAFLLLLTFNIPVSLLTDLEIEDSDSGVGLQSRYDQLPGG